MPLPPPADWMPLEIASGIVPGHFLVQPLQRSYHVLLDGCVAQVQGGSNLCVTLTVQPAANEYVSAQRRHCGQRLIEGSDSLSIDRYLLLGRGIAHEILAQRLRIAALQGAKMIMNQIGCDLKTECLRVADRLAARIMKEPGQGLLRQVFADPWVSHPSEDEAIQAVAVNCEINHISAVHDEIGAASSVGVIMQGLGQPAQWLHHLYVIFLLFPRIASRRSDNAIDGKPCADMTTLSTTLAARATRTAWLQEPKQPSRTVISSSDRAQSQT